MKKAFVNRLFEEGARLFQKGDYSGAEDRFMSCLKIIPNSAEVYVNLGAVYYHEYKLEQAKNCLTRANKLDPNNSVVYTDFGAVYLAQNRYSEAADCFLKATKLDPNNFIALFNWGKFLLVHDKNEAGVAYLEKAHKLVPSNSGVVALLYSHYRDVLDFRKRKRFGEKLNTLTVRDLANGELPGESPFGSITRTDDVAMNLKVAKIGSKNIQCRVRNISLQTPLNKPRSLKKKIKIGYLSEGFRDFPTTHNIVGVFEHHDRKRFEITAYSHGTDDKSNYRRRLAKAVDKFIDIKGQSVEEMAEKIRTDGVDILVDLKGYTGGAKLEIMALRPAPVQVSYLGFPGSTGANFMDYFVADKIVLPYKLAKYFSEKIVYMPHTYRPTDNKMRASKKKFKEADFGILKDSFVFGSFHRPYKIDEEMFKTWIRILRKVSKSVLLIHVTRKRARENLISYVKKVRFNKDRIVFVDKLSKEGHLARIRDLVDLALDTRIVNGHTTTVDCLWVGVPVVTIKGKHFASRVSASVLTAVGMEDLILNNLKDYEELVVKLAKDKNMLQGTRNRLRENKKSFPLFDTTRYADNLEKAYLLMWERHKKGLRPADLIIKE